MWQGFIITVVVVLWKVLSFIDSYLDGKLMTQVGKVAVIGMAAVSLLAPNAFAAGTKQFIDAETKAFMSWAMKPFEDLLNRPVNVPAPATTTSTTSTTTTTTTTDPTSSG